jgi:hypothetical protein
MKSSTRTLFVLTSIGLLPGAFFLVMGIVAYFHVSDPGAFDPDPELQYELPILFSFVWTVLIFVVVGVVVAARSLLRRSHFRRRMRDLGVMDEHGQWICSNEEAQRFQNNYR